LICLSALFADQVLPFPGPGFGAGQGAALLLGAGICLLSGNRGRRIIFNRLPLILANTLVLILMIEACALLALKILSGRPVEAPAGVFVPRMDDEMVYTPPPAVFFPFVGLRLEPGFAGPGVTTDSLGFRVTPEADTSSTAIEIHMYGGSTVYGWFLPDSLTIPALLQEALRGSWEQNLNVSNRGSATRNSTQSMIELLLALQTGDIPDAAVFYEGYNDAATAWYEGDPALALGSRRSIDRFSAAVPEPREPFRLSVATLAGLLARPESSVPALIPGSEPLGRGRDTYELAARVVEVYNSNCRQTLAMAGAFDIPVAMLWQPTLAAESRELLGQEPDFRASMDPGEVSLQEVVWKLAEENAAGGLYLWFGGCMNEAGFPCYVDYCHLNADGNRLVTDGMHAMLDSLGLPGRFNR
jgi:lysophospholipase L1-like esterase